MSQWRPQIGETLLMKREPEIIKDKYTVAVLKEDAIMGHVPYNMAPAISHFLKRDVNKGFAEIRGEAVNRGAGYGLEVPCVYPLVWAKAICR